MEVIILNDEIKMSAEELESFHDHGTDFRLASYQYTLLMENIKDFEKQLNLDEEIVLLLASFGQTVRLYVTDIGYANPSLIYFYGFIEGKGIESQLIQHVSQLNFLITSAKRVDDSIAARRIGFNA